MDAEALSEALSEAAEFDQDDEEEEFSPKEYLEALERIIDTLREGEASVAQGIISPQQWQHILNKAEGLISANCYTQYDEDVTDCVGLFGLPPDPSNHITTKVKNAGLSKTSLLSFLDMMLSSGMIPGGQERANMALNEFTPPPWSTTGRPSHNSNHLSRCTPEYNSEALSNVFHSAPAVDPVLQATFRLRDHFTGKPWSMAATDKVVMVSSGAGWKEKESHIFWYDVAPGEEGLREGSFKPKFAGPDNKLVADGSVFWAVGRHDPRIKAFTADQGKLLHTLNSEGYDGVIGVSEDMVFRGSKDGTFAKWTRSELVEHQPVLRSSGDSAVEPLGGRLTDAKLPFWFPESAELEVSMGQTPTTTFNIPMIDSPLKNLVRIPNSTRWLCSFAEKDEREKVPTSFGIRSFDLAQPESGASVAGLGLGSAVASLAIHKDMPDLFVAAGDDRYVRIFDTRHPLPQIVLQGHIKDVTSCAVAPFGGQFPIVFTGGSDEVVKVWDTRHTKACLYDMSAGTLKIISMSWNDERNTLYVLGENLWEDEDGRHSDYQRVTTGESEVERDQSSWWPKKAMTDKDYFGRRWCAVHHSVLEYEFTREARVDDSPAADEP